MFRCNNFCSIENRNITKLDPCSIFSLRNSNLKLFIIFSRYIWVALFYKTIVSLYPCFFKIILYHLIMSHYIFLTKVLKLERVSSSFIAHNHAIGSEESIYCVFIYTCSSIEKSPIPKQVEIQSIFVVRRSLRCPYKLSETELDLGFS